MGMKERNCVSLSGYADVLNEDEGRDSHNCGSRFLYKENPALDAGFSERYAFDQKSSST